MYCGAKAPISSLLRFILLFFWHPFVRWKTPERRAPPAEGLLWVTKIGFFLHNKQGIRFFRHKKKRLGVGKDASRRLERKTEAFQGKGLSVSRERPRRFRAKPRSWEANQCRQADTGLQNSPSKPRPKGSLFQQRPFGRISRIIKRNHAIQEARGEAES